MNRVKKYRFHIRFEHKNSIGEIFFYCSHFIFVLVSKMKIYLKADNEMGVS